jgi:IS5 family transposase
MHQTKKGNQWFFGMKAHIGVDADGGLVHTVTTTAANEADVEQVADLLHGKEERSGPTPATAARSRVERDDLHGTSPGGRATSPSCLRARPRLGSRSKSTQGQRAGEGGAPVPRGQAAVRLREGALPRFGKNTAHVVTLFALSNLWMAVLAPGLDDDLGLAAACGTTRRSGTRHGICR